MHRTPTASAVVVAAGSSARMRAGGGPEADGPRKPLLRLGGRTLLEHACAALAAVDGIAELVIVAHEGDLAAVRALAERSPALAKVRAVVAGGERRTDSVRLGVEATSGGAELIVVHDAARPLVEPAVVAEALQVAAEHGAALVAVPVQDTIKASSSGSFAERTLDRAVLWAAQTPQVFRAEVLRGLLERARAEGVHTTDEAALYELYVGPCPLVRGDPTNLKVTTPSDLLIAAAILVQRGGEGGT